MKVLFFSLLSLLAIVPAFSQNYEISITLKSRNDTVMLGHYFAKRDLWISDDTLVLKNGTGVFRGNKKLVKGVYFILNNRNRLDFIVGDQQVFGIVADTTDFINLTKFTSSPENDVFYEFQRYNADRGKQFQQLNEQFQSASSDAGRNSIRAQLQELNRERLEFIEKLADANSNLYVSKFLRALVPAETHLPEPPKDADGNVTDREFLYRWYRAHFFDNLNIFDPEMLRIPFYEEKVLEYLTRVIPQHPDTICVETDKILAKAQANDEIFRCILVSVFNHYVSSKVIAHENVWVHIADKWYIPFAKWSADDYIEKLKKEVADRKPNLIGNLAPPIEMLMVLSPDHFKAAALDTAIKFDVHVGTQIQDFRKTMKSKYTVLYFWDYSCGHCKQGIQELHKAWEDLKDSGLQVITIQAISTREAKGKWIDFANEHNLFGWTNAWCPYTYKFKELYNLSSFPSLYLLDEEHKIILKNIGPEQLKDIITQR